MGGSWWCGGVRSEDVRSVTKQTLYNHLGNDRLTTSIERTLTYLMNYCSASDGSLGRGGL